MVPARHAAGAERQLGACLCRNSKAAPADRADGKVSKPEPAGTKVDVKEKEKEEPKKKAGCCG